MNENPPQRDPGASPATGPFLAAVLACGGALARLKDRLDDHLGADPDAVAWGHVADANRILGLLAEAARVAAARTEAEPAGDEPVVASDTCPECGSGEVAVVSSVPGLALGRVEDGRFVPAGETELDWSEARTLRRKGGAVLACPACGARWVHPALEHDVP